MVSTVEMLLEVIYRTKNGHSEQKKHKRSLTGSDPKPTVSSSLFCSYNALYKSLQWT